jgi:two-component system nitrate/nitrite response regulator NarL
MSEVKVSLIEHDPISRHVIAQHLLAAEGIDLVTSLDRCGPDSARRLTGVDVAVVACGTAACCATAEGMLATVAPIATAGVAVLMLGTCWNRELIERLVDGGVSGFLVKHPQVEGLTPGILALFAGQGVMSTKLLQSYWGRRSPRRASVPTGRHLLTERERQVLDLLAQGNSTQEAAVTLRVSSATIKSHVSHSLTKLGARNRLEAVLLMQDA